MANRQIQIENRIQYLYEQLEWVFLGYGQNYAITYESGDPEMLAATKQDEAMAMLRELVKLSQKIVSLERIDG